MRFPVQTSALFVLLGMLLSPPPQEGHASSPPADGVQFCLPVDPEQWQRDEPRPASKWAADLDVGEPRTVRLFYFLPNDRPYRTEVVDSMKSGILDLQSFFAEQMEAHEQGNTTFQIETDDQGDPVVHRVDGDYTDSHYSSRGYTEGEIERAYDNAANIILIVMDVSTRSAHGRGTGTKGSGWAMIYGEWNWFAAAHELGHAFGLHHDFRDNEYIMSYGRANRSSAQLSACAAEFLAVHPYFNPDVPLENESPPIVELVSSGYPLGAASVPVRLRVRDDDGLRQVILFVRTKNPFLGGTPEVKACHGLSGETDTVVEFNFDGRLPSDNVGTDPEAHTTLSNTANHRIHVVVVDTDGNRTSTVSPVYFTLEAGHSPQHVATLDRPYYYDIGGLAISPDGTYLAIGTGGIVELLDARKRESITVFRHTEGNVYVNWSVAFSPDGAMVASGSANGTVKLWNVSTRENIATLEGHTGSVVSLDFSTNGTLLASGARDNTVKLWNVATGAHVATLEGHTDGVFSLAFFPDGKLASKAWADGGTVKLWNVTTKSEISTFDTDANGTVAFSPDGAILAAPSRYGDVVKLWDVATGTQIATLKHMREYGYAGLAYSTDGTILAVAANGLIEIWDVPTRELMATVSGGPGGVASPLFSPNGTKLIGKGDKKVKFWDVSEWTAPITPVSQRTSQVREAILGVVGINDPNVSSYADVTETHLGGITALYLNGRSITSLAHGDFDGLTGLEELRLYSNQLTSLPEDTFSGLSSLETLRFGLNQLTTLPSGLLEGLTSLTDLRMIGNRLTALPDGIFEGLTGLTTLRLGGNAVDPLPINISLEKTGEGQFKAVAPTGAPFDIVLSLSVTNGSIDGGATTLTIPAGSVESEPLTVTRTPGATLAFTVDIGSLPGLPSNHTGYALDKSGDLPLKVTKGDIGATLVLTMTVGRLGENTPYPTSRFGFARPRSPFQPHGSLSTRTFSFKGITYTVTALYYDIDHNTRFTTREKYLFFETSPLFQRGFVLFLNSQQFNSSACRYQPWFNNKGWNNWDNVDLNWSSGQTVRIRIVETTSMPPGAPKNLQATTHFRDVTLTWEPPVNADPISLPVADYELRISDDGGNIRDPDWDDIYDSGPGEENRSSVTIGSGRHRYTFSNGTEYTFEVRARGGDGSGDAARMTLIMDGITPMYERTVQVRDAIVAHAGVNSALDVTEAHLAEITELNLSNKGITSLKYGDFPGLTALTHLNLHNNQLGSLPDGLFQGLTSLTQLRLGGNSVDPLPLTVSLEKVADRQFKAVAPTGAPFDFVLPLTVTNGSISGGATTITIPKGSVGSQPLTVTRTSGTTAPVTVDIGTLPGIPSSHQGYTLVKSVDLPLEIFSSGETGTTAAATDFNGDGKTDFVDFFLFADAYGGTDARFDLDGNGTVDFADFFRFVDAFGS